MAVKATDPHQPQQVPWSRRKEDMNGDNVVVVAEDVMLVVPLHHTADPHLLVENPLLNMIYSTIRRHNKHKNTETTLKHSRYILEENTQNILRNSSAL